MESPLKVNVFTASVTLNLGLKIIVLVFWMLSIRCHLRQYFVSLSSSFCKPTLVSETRIRSSACNRWFIVWMPILILGSSLKKLCISSTYAWNNVGLIVPPCSTPQTLLKSSLTSEFNHTLCFTEHVAYYCKYLASALYLSKIALKMNKLSVVGDPCLKPFCQGLFSLNASLQKHRWLLSTESKIYQRDDRIVILR